MEKTKRNSITDPVFYVYALLDPRKPGKFSYRDSQEFEYEVFYVGKGKGWRGDSHTTTYSINNDRNKYKTNKIKKIIKETGRKPIVVKLYENLYEDIAFELEKFLIKQIGRENLCNLTDGGNGTSGYIYTEEMKRNMSKNRKEYAINNPEYKIKLSEIHKEVQNRPEVKEKRRRTILETFKNPDVIKKMSLATKKSWENPEYREKVISAANKVVKTLESRKANSERQFIAQNTPEAKYNMGVIKREYFSIPENREKQSNCQLRPDVRLEKSFNTINQFRKEKFINIFEWIESLTSEEICKIKLKFGISNLDETLKIIKEKRRRYGKEIRY